MGNDGSSDSTVEQIGTEQDVVNGTPVYSAWWEMYSTGNQQPEQTISSMTIEPGDSITASVRYITSGTYAGDFYLSIVDTSRANDSSAPTKALLQRKVHQPYEPRPSGSSRPLASATASRAWRTSGQSPSPTLQR